MKVTTPARATSFNRALALLVAGTYFMEILDGTIIATAAASMAEDLGVAPVDINISMTAYLITLAVGIPISGWLAEKFGAKQVFAAAIAIFTIASLLCALSPNLLVLSLARVLQGAGGAMMVPVGRLVVLNSAQKRDYLQAVAYITWPALIAPVIAPALGGLLVTYASWHWIFLLNVPLGILAFVVALEVVPPTRVPELPRPDWLGFVLCGVALAALVGGMELLGAGHGSFIAACALLATCLIMSVAALMWFKRAKFPLLDLRALRIQTFRVGNAGGALYRLVINAVPFLLPLMFMLGFGWSPVEAGLMTMAVFAGNVLIKPATTPLIRRFGFRTVIVFSAAAGALILGCCAFLTAETPLAVTAVVLFLSGVFRSIGFSAYNTVQFADIAQSDMTAANTLSSTIAQIATGLGVAVAALVVRVFEATLPSNTPAAGAYQLTFAVLAVLMLAPVIEALAMNRFAGDEVRAKRK